MTDTPHPPRGSLRRSFLSGTAASAGGLTAAFRAGEADAQAEVQPQAGNLVDIAFCLNGAELRRAVDPCTTALDLLREGEGMTGNKLGCRHGQCGACTLHMDGVARLGCLTLAAQLDGHEVTTIEGLADRAVQDGTATDDGLHPL